jgi:hypothetical protein
VCMAGGGGATYRGSDDVRDEVVVRLPGAGGDGELRSDES